METLHVNKLLSNPPLNVPVRVNGWVKTKRDSKIGLSFIHINDGSCFANLQIVAAKDLKNYATEIQKITSGCSISVVGEIVPSQGKGQSFEMQAKEIQVVGWVEEPDTYPIQPKRHSFEYLREVAHLRPRTNTIGAVTRIRNCLSQNIHKFLADEGFLWIHTPIITTCDAEGAGELFRVSTLDLANLPLHQEGKIDFSKDFFGQEAYLTVSGQLNVEAYCLAFSKVYTFGPTFRAENSNTSRHLAEFWMIEPEIAFANLDDICQLSMRFLKTICSKILTEQQDDINFLAKFVEKDVLNRLEMITNASFEIMSYTEAIEKLKNAKKSFEYPVKWGSDLQTEHERYICENLTKKPTIIINYPKEIKGFYMRQNDDGKTVAAMDVLTPGIGEIIGGSQREERINVLDHRMDELKLDKTVYNWYRDLRKYGTVPHAGFGLGLERLLGYITGVPNVRDLIPFPRTPNNASF